MSDAPDMVSDLPTPIIQNHMMFYDSEDEEVASVPGAFFLRIHHKRYDWPRAPKPHANEIVEQVAVLSKDTRPKRILALETALNATGYYEFEVQPAPTYQLLIARIRVLEAKFAARDVSKEKNAGCKARIHALEKKFFDRFGCNPKDAPAFLAHMSVKEVATFADSALLDVEAYFAAKKLEAEAQIALHPELSSAAGDDENEEREGEYGMGSQQRSPSPASPDSTLSSVSSSMFESSMFEGMNLDTEEDLAAAENGDGMEMDLN